MNYPPPKSVRILADYCTTYAWDEEGSVILLAPEWPDIPGLPDVEEKLVAWADTYDIEMSRSRSTFDWAAHDRRGRIIAVELAKLLKPKGVPVYFGDDKQPLTGDEALEPEPWPAARPGEPSIPLPPRMHRVASRTPSVNQTKRACPSSMMPTEILPENSPFILTVGETDVGWCGVEVRFGNRTWRCEASYLGPYPLLPLIHAAVELLQYFMDNDTGSGMSDAGDVWDCLAADEPGGIVLRVMPHPGGAGQRVKVQVFRYRGDALLPSPDNLPDIPPEAEGVITLDAFARAVYEAGANALARQGITNLSLNWEHHLMTHDNASLTVFPVDRFLHLHRQLHGTRGGGGNVMNPFAGDLAILQEISRRDAGQGSNTGGS